MLLAFVHQIVHLKHQIEHLKHQIVDRGIGKTPEMAIKCSVHPKFVGKSEKGVPNSKEK